MYVLIKLSVPCLIEVRMLGMSWKFAEYFLKINLVFICTAILFCKR